MITPENNLKNVSFGTCEFAEYINPSSGIYSPTQPFYGGMSQVPFLPFSMPVSENLTPAPISQPDINPPPLRKSILKKKKSSVAAKSAVSRSTSSGSCKDSSQESIKIETDDEDDAEQLPALKKQKTDSVSVNVLVDLIKSLNSLSQQQSAAQVPSAAAISTSITQAAIKCSGPIRDLRSAMDLTRPDLATSKKLVRNLL